VIKVHTANLTRAPSDGFLLYLHHDAIKVKYVPVIVDIMSPDVNHGFPGVFKYHRFIGALDSRPSMNRTNHANDSTLAESFLQATQRIQHI
jgi:hypothetical protein